MASTELYPNPTVKQVIFQIRFPSLFYIEDKIGEFQLSILERFPESALLHRRQFLVVDAGPEARVDIPGDADAQGATKIWQFTARQGVKVNVLNNPLDIASDSHKTYDTDREGVARFRDTISYVLDRFFRVAPVPTINRIGLRYIDECPVPAMENGAFSAYYNTGLALHRFSLDSVQSMELRSTVKRGDGFLRYLEALKADGEGPPRLTLDFDGFMLDVPRADYLQAADDLHQIISSEYESSIREPLRELMRGHDA